MSTDFSHGQDFMTILDWEVLVDEVSFKCALKDECDLAVLLQYKPNVQEAEAEADRFWVGLIYTESSSTAKAGESRETAREEKNFL